MTLILSVGTRQHTIMVTDRRLTVNGRVQDDDAGKLGVLTLQDARLLFGFSGLARFGDFSTEIWLLDALYECAEPDRLAGSTLDRLKEKATDIFASAPLLRKVPMSSRKLSVLFAGYLMDGRGVGALLSNFEDAVSGTTYPAPRDKFELYHQTDDQQNPFQPMIQWTGHRTAVLPEDTTSLCEIIDAKLPAAALKGKALELMKEIAARPAAKNLIGTRYSVGTLTPNLNEAPATLYVSDTVSDTIYMANQINATQRGKMAIALPRLSVPGAPIVVPKVGRNRPCPCGSGKKFKHCHGRR